MATLLVRRVGSRPTKLLTLGGDPSNWAVRDGGVGRLVPPEDVPVLALLAMWLERAADSRYATVI